MRKSVLIVLIVFFVAWDGFWWIMGVRPISPWRLEAMLDSKTSRPILLDVRTSGEYDWFHIAGAISASGRLAGPDSAVVKDKSTPIVVICMTGHRSVLSAYRLKRQGFRQVYNLTWGMLGWVLTGAPTIGENDVSEDEKTSEKAR